MTTDAAAPSPEGETQEERIRIRAYWLWVEEGYPDGRHEENWVEATRLVEAEDALAATAGATK